MAEVHPIASNRMFGGWHTKYAHDSAVLGCDMHFSAFFPPQYVQNTELPVVYWLSGLTCNDDNFSHKAGAQRIAAELGLVLLIPDTSPRGADIPNDDAYDLGQGAGFYLDATEAPWNTHFKMYDYILNELPALFIKTLKVSSKWSLMGHSMGGHGALTLALKNPTRFTSVSAFAPIVNPSNSPWGQKALSAYLGEKSDQWLQYDACELLKQHGCSLPIKIDQGLADNFLTDQKLTKPFDEICRERGVEADIQYHEGYDHSYYFISTFIDAHLRFHARALRV